MLGGKLKLLHRSTHLPAGCPRSTASPAPFRFGQAAAAAFSRGPARARAFAWPTWFRGTSICRDARRSVAHEVLAKEEPRAILEGRSMRDA
jgi:hypothetical protein